jgi:hypothetical protein
MTRQAVLSYLIIVLFLLGFVSISSAEEQDINWDHLNKSLIDKMATDDSESQRSAMRDIILFGQLSGDKLDIDETTFDLVNIYATNKDPKVRQLVVVTLHSMKNKWAMKYLSENLRYEKDENLKRFIAYCLYDYHKKS